LWTDCSTDAAPESYLKLATNFDELRKLPSYLGVQRFSNPPLASDLAEFTIDAADIKDLKTCKPAIAMFSCPRKQWNSSKDR
jgi:hypothetical protein